LHAATETEGHAAVASEGHAAVATDTGRETAMRQTRSRGVESAGVGKRPRIEMSHHFESVTVVCSPDGCVC